MPEFVHVFQSGKMNKDLDERLVPNGQYRDALNINVSGSEGSDSGAINNVKGNLESRYKSLNASTGVYTEWTSNYIDNALQNPVCIGSITENVNEKISEGITETGDNITTEIIESSESSKEILTNKISDFDPFSFIKNIFKTN